jgi:hypothetical protein
MSRWLEKLPKSLGFGIVRGSERAFKTFINLLRADSFDAMAASLSKTQKPTLEEAKAIANYINIATGRGKIGIKKGSVAVGLNTAFFAPKLVASRFNLLAGQPLYGGTMRTRAMVAAEYARFLTGVGVIYALGAVLHDPKDDDKKPFITFDPRATDFGKMRFGNTWVDPLTGLGQTTAFLGKEITGEKVTPQKGMTPLRDSLRPLQSLRDHPSTQKKPFKGDTGYTVLGRFLRTKLAPIPGALVNMIDGQDVVGKPVTLGSTALNLTVPMSFQNVADVMKEHGVTGGSAITLTEMLGMGVQYRDPNALKPKPASTK